MDKNVLDCATYFRKRPAYRRIMEEILQKYRGLGHVGGQVSLPDATVQECEAARAIFGRPFSRPLKFKIIDFETALQSTTFCGVTLHPLLEAYFDTSIQTKKDTHVKKEQAFRNAISQAMEISSSAACHKWLNALAERNGNGYSLIRQEINKDSKAPSLLCNACKAMDWLATHNGVPVRIAILSAQATSDPHALDSNTTTGKLFLHLLAFCYECEFPKGAEQRDALYYMAGILCDSISSTVTQVGLILNNSHGEHPAFGAFRLRAEGNTLTLMNLSGLVSAASPSGRVYLVENQMVFSQLCDHVQQFRSPLICTSGQLQVAVLRLLDLLDASGTEFFYSGDFDGEGLSIAERLMYRYPKNMRLWHMTPEDYAECRSSKVLDNARLPLLNTLTDGALAQTASAILEHGVAGYQEMLLSKLLHDLTKTP